MSNQERPISRGFKGRRVEPANRDRVPPGQHVTQDFPVLSAGPTPHVPLSDWTFSMHVGTTPGRTWTWTEFQDLPQTRVTVDIHCVTKWSKLHTVWAGVTLDTLLDVAGLSAPPTAFVMAHCDGGYSTNVPTSDLVGGRAMIATRYAGEPLAASHGGPARLLIPHLYFWKSAKWIRSLEFISTDRPGFWEGLGYHIYGDPWREQRYRGD